MNRPAEPGKLDGAWQRSVMIHPDQSRDTETWVLWLQSGTEFSDLRQPANRPDMRSATCLDALDTAQMLWLARQNGFAGSLVFDGTYFEWQRVLGFQPEGPSADRAKLFFRAEILVEEGQYAPYIEEWFKREETGTSGGALHLRCAASGCTGLLVRHAGFFMFARDRGEPLERGADLAALVRDAASDGRRRALIDCEISFGRIDQESWRIERSTLPWRESADLAPLVIDAGQIWQSADVTASGVALRRSWRIVSRTGELGLSAADHLVELGGHQIELSQA